MLTIDEVHAYFDICLEEVGEREKSNLENRL